MVCCDSGKCYLPFFPCAPRRAKNTFALAQAELEEGLRALSGPQCALVPVENAGDAFEIRRSGDGYAVHGGETGLLYGVYRFLTALAAGEEPALPRTEPAFSLRMLNHWDNMDGTVERGYAGRSLFFEDGQFRWDEERMLEYGRLLAAVGINAVCINNVNVKAPADGLITEALLPEVKKLADLLRPFGVRLILSVDYALPVTMGLPTADPLDEGARKFWEKQAALVYSYVPDLCGFLVKADSEFRPGPYTYGRNHAEGANLLARALRPYGGKLIWRCFVYNCRQDWRDHSTDRPKAAYDNYAYLDGQFDDNVILQVKNGPYDFQVREPVSPLLLAMPETRKALEVQLAQEYTGQQIDLYYMPPMWHEVMDDLRALPDAVAAVTNLGDDENWTGHQLAQANLYAYGRFAWEGRGFDGARTAKTWIALTFGADFGGRDALLSMLLASRRTYEKYTSPLGLCWMVKPNGHYGPDPEGYEFALWGTYHRANREAVGIDRTESGTGYTAQYPDPLRALYESPETCPELMLLFFHRLRYDYVMRDGRTLLQRIYDDHFEGAEEAEAMLESWKAMQGSLPEKEYAHALRRFEAQVKNAREWRDIINTYFYRFTGIPDNKGRKIYD